MALPGSNFPGGMPGEPASPIPYVRSGRPQPTTVVKTRSKGVVRPKGSKGGSKRGSQPNPPPNPPPQDPYAAAVNSAANLKYGPQIQATQQQVANAQAGQVNAQNWYHDYQNTLVAQQQHVAQQAQALANALGAYNPAAVSTGNAQADALAAQAAQSQKYLGQSFAGTEGQMTQNVANEFATGLIPGAALRSQEVQQGLTNQIGQLQGQVGQLKGQEGDYKTQVREQLQAATEKAGVDAANLQVKQGTLNYLSGNAQVGQANTQANTAKTIADLQFFQTHGYYPQTGAPKGPSSTEKINQAKLDFFNKNGYWPPTGPPKAPKNGAPGSGRSQSQVNAHHKVELQVNNAVEDVQRGFGHGLKQDAIRGAMQQQKIPTEVIDAAFTLANGGTLSNSQIKQLKLAGLIAAPRAWTTAQTISPSKRPR